MMGRGLVHPVDLHHADNPATHPELLDVLSASLADLDFDIQAFLAEIALSESYQRSVEMPVSLKEHVLQATQTLPALKESLAQATSEEQAAFETLEPLRAELDLEPPAVDGKGGMRDNFDFPGQLHGRRHYRTDWV